MLDPSHPLAQLMARDRRYKLDAYGFVQEALGYAHESLGMGREQVSEEPPEPPEPSEPTVEDPSAESSARRAAFDGPGIVRGRSADTRLEEYGYMAKSVLASWGVHTTRDFGNIVFNMIEIGHMKKTEQDRIEDFDDVFDFDAAFCKDFKISPTEPKHG